MNTAVIKQMLQDNYKASLFHTAQTLLGYKDITIDTHKPIVTALEDDTTRKLICVPRGTFKSSLGSVAYPIWLLINNPNLRILIDSEIYTNSAKFVREIRQHLESERFTSIFGDWSTSNWNESELTIRPRTKVIKEGSVTASGIGAQKTSQHYDVIIGDDMNTPGNSTTAEGRKNVISHYQYNQSILSTTGTYVVIGTRYSDDDLIGWIIKNELGLKSLEILKQMPKDKGVYNLEPNGLLGV